MECRGDYENELLRCVHHVIGRTSWDSSCVVSKSNNIFIKYLGCFVAFRWAYGWIEDMYSFQPMILALWMMIGMCISEKFRNMNDAEMKLWLTKLVK